MGPTRLGSCHLHDFSSRFGHDTSLGAHPRKHRRVALEAPRTTAGETVPALGAAHSILQLVVTTKTPRAVFRTAVRVFVAPGINSQLSFANRRRQALATSRVAIRTKVTVAIVVHQTILARTAEQQTMFTSTIAVFVACHTRPEFGQAQARITAIAVAVIVFLAFHTDTPTVRKHGILFTFSRLTLFSFRAQGSRNVS
jgi:hypothetical protein